jgi:copper oxidase (laccase) domain-containing protein
VTLFLQEQAEVANQLIAWIGPSISAPHYEVGSEVRDAFLREGEQRGHALSEFCFEKSVNAQHYMADLPRIAKERLNAMGVEAVYGGDLCTYSNPERFYSYRRQNPTGRFASLIWFNPRP